jgi:hypothetical protein
MASSPATVCRRQRATPELTRAAAKAVGYALGDHLYAVVGGAACALLGAQRVTDDVDIVVPQGTATETKAKLKSQETYFEFESRASRTYYKSNPRIQIEILSPPTLFRENFSVSTPVIFIHGVKVLKPALILNAKCNSILGRATEEKKENDAADIQFCLCWSAVNNVFPTAAEVPNADREFVEWFLSTYRDEQLWIYARYNFETCKLFLAFQSNSLHLVD